MTRIKFRNDIQYLRGVAVLGVIGYHAPFEFLKGGWLGVDVFFVVSGFLISNIIISDLFQNKFSFKRFYLRRVQRIIPALLTSLILTTIVATFLLSEKALYEYGLSLRSSLAFYSNFHFLNLDIYNAEPGKYSPLLHMWSLSIEEQYYIFIPIFIFIVFKYNKNLLSKSFLLLFFASLFLSFTEQTVSKFYLLQYRAWELLLGAVALYLYTNFKFKYINFLGLVLILFSFYYFPDERILEIEPKLTALIGVFLFLISETKIKSNFWKYFLHPLGLVGLSSYSAYLLHQPIFAMYRQYMSINFQTYRRIEILLVEKLILIMLTLLISLLFYKLVEKPYLISFENGKKALLGLCFSILLLFSFNTEKISDYKYSQGIETTSFYIEFKQKLRSYTREIDKYSAYISDQNCFDAILEETCVFNKNKKKNIVLLGDSHSIETGRLISTELEDFRVTILTGNNCIYLYGIVDEDACKGKDKERFDDYVSKFSDSIFIYHAFLSSASYQEVYNFPEALIDTFDFLTKNNNTVLLVSPTPVFPYNPVDLYGHDYVFGDTISMDLEYWSKSKTNIKINQILKNYNNSNLRIIDSTKIFCDDIIQNSCVAAYEDSILFRDNHHLTIEGAELIFEQIKFIIENYSS